MNNSFCFSDKYLELKPFDDWTPTLKRRGFEDLVAQFLDWIHHPEDSMVALELSKKSHEVCEYLVMELEK